MLDIPDQVSTIPDQKIPDQLVLDIPDQPNSPVQHIEHQPCTGVSYVSLTSGVLHNLLMVIVVENDPGKSIVTEGMSRDCEQNNPLSKSFVTKNIVPGKMRNKDLFK